jgi:hypothetical protein
VFYPFTNAPIYSTRDACEAAARIFRESTVRQDKFIRVLAVCIPVEDH